METRMTSGWLRPLTFAILAAAFGAGTASLARAEEADAATDESTEEQLQSMMSDLLERQKEIDELRKQIERAGHSAEVEPLESELSEKRDRFRREIGEFTDLVVAGEDAGADVAAGRALAARLLEAEASKIRDESAEVSKKIFELSDKIANATPEEASAAEGKLDRAIVDSNELLEQFHDNIEERQALGLPVDADLALIEERLERRASLVGGSLKSTKDEIDEIRARPDSDKDAEAQQTLADLRDRRDILAESQRLNAKLMDEYGADTTEIRQGIISATGKISEDVLNKDVAMGLLQESMAGASDWLRANGASLVFQALMFLLVLLAFGLVARIARGAVRRALNRSNVKVSSLAKDFFIKSTGRTVMLLGFIIAIAQLGIEVAPLLAGLGIAGFVVGFALQDTLSNFASGMMILVYRPFDVGDVIEAGGVSGKVDQMNLVSTMVLTFDNQLLVVPNTKIWGDVIRNVTHRDQRRVDLTFGIGYSDDIPTAERILTEIVAAHDKVLDDPEPVIRLHELGESSVNFIVRPWSKTSDYWDVYWDVTREVKRRFDEEGVSIPFPQRDVHIYQRPGGGRGEGDEGTQHSNTKQSGQDVTPGDDDP